MARYIDAEKLIEHLNDLIEECENPNVDTQSIAYGTVLGLKGALSYAETLPTADVVEAKHGEWIRNEPNPEQMKAFHDLGIGKAMALKSIYWSCSCCGTWGTPRYKYCPNCGAKMDGAKE